jgi:hypothetical protein
VPFRGHARHFCKSCGRARLPDELFSARGKCDVCGNGQMLEQTGQMRNHSGHHFEDWRRRMAASVGAVILDDKSEQG